MKFYNDNYDNYYVFSYDGKKHAVSTIKGFYEHFIIPKNPLMKFAKERAIREYIENYGYDIEEFDLNNDISNQVKRDLGTLEKLDHYNYVQYSIQLVKTYYH